MTGNPDRGGRPEESPEDGEMRELLRLFAEAPPPEPSRRAWREALDGIDARTRPSSRLRRWLPRVVLGVVAVAASFGLVAVSRAFWATPAIKHPGDTGLVVVARPDDEGFDVARASEIEVIRVQPTDADRILVGVPLMGSLDFAAPGDIEVIGTVPRAEVSRGAVPMIVATQLGGEGDE